MSGALDTDQVEICLEDIRNRSATWSIRMEALEKLRNWSEMDPAGLWSSIDAFEDGCLMVGETLSRALGEDGMRDDALQTVTALCKAWKDPFRPALTAMIGDIVGALGRDDEKHEEEEFSRLEKIVRPAFQFTPLGRAALAPLLALTRARVSKVRGAALRIAEWILAYGLSVREAAADRTASLLEAMLREALVDDDGMVRGKARRVLLLFVAMVPVRGREFVASLPSKTRSACVRDVLRAGLPATTPRSFSVPPLPTVRRALNLATDTPAKRGRSSSRSRTVGRFSVSPKRRTRSTSRSSTRSNTILPRSHHTPSRQPISRRRPRSAAPKRTLFSNNPSATPAREELVPGARVGVRRANGEILIGAVRFVGQTHAAKGIWVGVELDEPHGKNNGSIDGTPYFLCKENHGIFVRLARVLPSSALDQEPTRPRSPLSQEQEKEQEQEPPKKQSEEQEEEDTKQVVAEIDKELEKSQHPPPESPPHPISTSLSDLVDQQQHHIDEVLAILQQEMTLLETCKTQLESNDSSLDPAQYILDASNCASERMVLSQAWLLRLQLASREHQE